MSYCCGQAGRYSRENDLFDSDSAWSDEILWASPLDQFDCYQRFSSLLSCTSPSSRLLHIPQLTNVPVPALSSANASLYQQAVGGLDGTQQAELGDIASKANEGGDAVVALAMATKMKQEGEAED